MLYCSLECYNDQVKHLKCQESFCQEQVEEHLKSKKSTMKERNKMNEVLLKEFRGEGDEQEGDGDQGEDGSLMSELRLTELLKFIEGGEEPDLTEDEKRMFNKYLTGSGSGEKEQVVSLWTPWW